MADFIITAGAETFKTPIVAEKSYTIKYTKEVEDVNGNKVVIIDEGRTEIVTKDGLLAQKAQYEKLIEGIDEKLMIIAEL